MENFSTLMNQTFLANTLWDYAIFVAILLAGLLFKRLFSIIFSRLLFRLFKGLSADGHAQRFRELMHRPIAFSIMVVVVYIAFSQLSMPTQWEATTPETFGVRYVLHRIYFVFLYGAIIWVFLRVTDFLSLVLQARAGGIDDKYSGQVIPFFIDFIKIIIVIFGILLILGSVFNLNVGTLVAGLGIGGLAIALAAKETLENLFGSFTIFLDKPFVVGDMVRVAGITGVVEKVGFRSTRLRTLEKSFVTLPNRKMIDSELDNLTMRTFRRGHFTLGLTYSTSSQQLKTIVADIQHYIDDHPNTNSEGLVRFHDFGASSLDIMVLFFVDTMDWTVYLDVKQEILYRIIDIVTGHGADFAFPTTSVHIEKEIK